MSAPYKEIVAGGEPPVTTLGILAGGQGVIPALTPLVQDATNGALVVWDGTNAGQAVYVTAFSIDATSQTQAQVYKSGVLNVDALNWPKSVTTLSARVAAFVGSPISVQPLR